MSETFALPFHGRVCIVTGAGSGIGAACAMQFWTAGAHVIAADKRTDALEATALELGPRYLPFHCDVTRSDEVDDLLENAVARLGQLDVMVNNVGDSVAALLKDVTDAQWHALLAINLSSAFFGIRAALRPMLARGKGAIVNISSGAGLNGSPGMGPYAAAKAALINLTKTAAVENARSGVRINCVTPGPIATPAATRMLDTVPNGRAGYEGRLLAGRLGEADDIADAVLFLASDRARYVNGANLVVDAGASARHGEIYPPPQEGHRP